MIVVAPSRFASVSQIDFVPTANFSTSNTPAGPFHTTVFAPASSFLKFSIVAGPQSNPCAAGAISFTLTTFVSAFIVAKAVKPVEIAENKNIVEE